MVLTRTLFTRVEYNKVSKDEIELLGIGVKPFLQTLRNGVEFVGNKSMPSFATFLARHLLFYKDWALETRGKRSSLAVGWMVTPILKFKGIKLPEDQEKWKLIDESYLARAQFFKGKVGTGFAYNVKLETTAMAQVVLPNNLLTDIESPANIFFTPSQDSLYDNATDVPIEAYRGRKHKKEMDEPLAPAEEQHHGPSLDPNAPAIYGGKRYHFNPYEGAMPNSATYQAHHHIKFLQRWCKWQDRTMEKMARKYKKLEKTVKTMGKKIKELTRNAGATASPPQEWEFDGLQWNDEMIYGNELVVYEEGGSSMAQQGKEGEIGAKDSSSPCSSNPSLSLGSSSPSPSL